jgi:hypothetical protein
MFLKDHRPDGVHLSLDTLHAVIKRVLATPHSTTCAVVMLPGSFNPVHREHVHSLEISAGDTTPHHELTARLTWHSKCTHIGNVLKQGIQVVGAFLQPSSDHYVRQKVGPEQTICLEDRCECCDSMLAEATNPTHPYGVYRSGQTNGMAALGGLVDLLNEALCEVGGAHELQGFYVLGADSLLRLAGKNPLAQDAFLGGVKGGIIVVGREGSEVPVPPEGLAAGWHLALGTALKEERTSDVSSTQIRAILQGCRQGDGEGGTAATMTQEQLLVEAGCSTAIAASLMSRRRAGGLFLQR